MKVLTVVGTRPELIKLSRVIAELDRCTQHVLVHTGQNYDPGLSAVFFEQLGIRQPDRWLGVAGGTATETIAKALVGVDNVLADEKPQAFLILGDTNSCLSAIPAKRRKVPVFHMEAGNRSFDERVPEEINRRIVDHISDINLVYTEHARRHLLAEGIRPETVIKTGSPMAEVLAHHADQINQSGILTQIGLAEGGYFLVSAHREENVDIEPRLAALIDALRKLAAKNGVPVVVSTHPRTRARLEAQGLHEDRDGVRFLQPLGFLDYVKLQRHARCVISDSGTITEEASLLNIPAVTIRQAHERPEGMDEGTLVMCGLAAEDLIPAVDLVIGQHRANSRRFRIPADYQADNVAAKVVRIILSYTEYVNCTVWRKT
jgi:UDP-N-acetylglucosamine 2-epimerase (non-hydrolysing)